MDDGVDLYWIPVGAGGRVVAPCSRAYERLCALREGRRPQALFHAALVVTVGGSRTAVEMAPVWSSVVADRGVVVEGPVGLRVLGRSRLFRYEVRRWVGGRIPDLAYAVGGRRRVATGPGPARRTLEAVAEVPALTWGRDERACGDMWNSNSLVAWALVVAGVGLDGTDPPTGGRAPGWAAGRTLARAHEGSRQQEAR